MTKKGYIFGLVILTAFLATGCGIPEADYKTVITERDSAQAELQSTQRELESTESELQSVLESAESELQSVQDELDTVKSELSSLKSQLSSSQSTVSNQRTKISKATAYLTALHISFYPQREAYDIPQKLAYPTVNEWGEALMNAVEATGDDTFLNLAVDLKTGSSEAVARFWSHAIIMIGRSLE